MKRFVVGLNTLVVMVLLAGAALAADGIAGGTVKGVNAEKKEFVLTDSAGKDWTIKFGDDVVVNQAGKETNSGLKAGDLVNVCYEKGALTWTAHYILVQKGDSENWELLHGTVKSYDADKKDLTLTDDDKKDWSFNVRDAKAYLNRESAKFDQLKIGEHVLAILAKADGKTNVKTVMCERK